MIKIVILCGIIMIKMGKFDMRLRIIIEILLEYTTYVSSKKILSSIV